jgi:hypothetical protein
MSPTPPTDSSDDWGPDASFEGTRRRQARLGYQLSPAERLEWLERILEEFPEAVAKTQELKRRREAER